jgi:hypothetical protein
MNKLFCQYPNLCNTNDVIMIEPINGTFLMFSEDIEHSEYNAWNTKGDNLTEKLTSAIEEVKTMKYNSDDKLVLIIQCFLDMLCDIAGFNNNGIQHENDIDLPPYDGANDKLWNILKNKYSVNTNRMLHVYTYGSRFIFEPPKDCRSDCVFDASILRGSVVDKSNAANTISIKSLSKLRGTSLKVQEEIRGAKLFVQFITKLVERIELENLSVISITCKAGHHRSVACAEMLNYLYPNIIITHLTINN